MTEEFYRWLLQLIREDRLVKFYQSPKWRRLREKAMKRDHYECQECRRLGKYHRVENVHHIKEVKDRPDLALGLIAQYSPFLVERNDDNNYLSINVNKQIMLNTMTNKALITKIELLEREVEKLKNKKILNKRKYHRNR